MHGTPRNGLLVDTATIVLLDDSLVNRCCEARSAQRFFELLRLSVLDRVVVWFDQNDPMKGNIEEFLE